MVNYGPLSTDSTGAMFRRKAIRKVYLKTSHFSGVMDTSQLVGLQNAATPNTATHLYGLNASSPLQDVKSALRRMRSVGSRFKPK